jgi:hypothetical protein
VKIAAENKTEKPAEVKVINVPEVKLGLDSDRWRVAGAVALIAVSLGGLAALYILRRRKGAKPHGA